MEATKPAKPITPHQVRPCLGRLLLKVHPPEKVTDTGIHIPVTDDDDATIRLATVLAVGPGRKLQQYRVAATDAPVFSNSPDFSPGQTILVSTHDLQKVPQVSGADDICLIVDEFVLAHIDGIEVGDDG